MGERHTTQEPGTPGYKSQPGQTHIITHQDTTQSIRKRNYWIFVNKKFSSTAT